MTIDIGVLTVVMALLVAIALWRVVVYRRSWGPARRSAGITVVVTVVALIIAGIPEARHQWAQARASALVEHVSGVHGSVARCQRFTADLFDINVQSGFVAYGSHQAQLRRNVCNDLASWLVSSKIHPSPAQVQAVHVTVHEAMHVSGEFSEAKAECSAMQHDAEAAVFLGATPGEGRALAEAYYRDVYPNMPDEYRTGDCRPDGPLDLTPGDGQFP